MDIAAKRGQRSLEAILRQRLRVIPGAVSRNPVLVVVACIWLILLVAAIAPSLFTSTDPNSQDLFARFVPPIGFHGGSTRHWLGTDDLGRDEYTRIVYGARVSVFVGFGAVILGGSVGTIAGLLAGYFTRSAGAVVSGLIDVQMAFPGLLLALAVVIMLGHAGIGTLVIVLGATGWAGYARVLRGLIIPMREREFVLAAKASGTRTRRILVTHLLPNVMGTVSVLAVLDLGRAILSEASLSFLGLGIQSPGVSWGLMLSEGREYIFDAWWLVTLPGIAIAVAVLSANVMAVTLQQRIDPLLRTTRSL